MGRRRAHRSGGWADLVIVAPATYDLLGKLHAGIADDVTSTFLTAVVAPVFIAPAMNHHMWLNPINQRNVRELRALGYRFIDPERGGLACSWEGEGRMQEPEAILDAVRTALRGGLRTGTLDAASDEGEGTAVDSRDPAGGSLAGRTILVSAAGTQEALDPVRYWGTVRGQDGVPLAGRRESRRTRTLGRSCASASEACPGAASAVGRRDVVSLAHPRGACACC